MTTYHVTAERSGRWWALQCVEHPGALSQARRLSEVDDLMREAIAFVAEVDPADIEIDLDIILPERVKRALVEARDGQAHLEELQQQVASASRSVTHALARDLELTGVDTARILGVSEQRVSQLLTGMKT